MLNYVLRPVLATWHPLLFDYESRRDRTISQIKHERDWPSADSLRRSLNDVRLQLIEYANLLAVVGEVPSLSSESEAQR